MLDQLLLVIGKLNELSRSNPMLATVLGAGGATAIVMSLRQIPGRIVNFIFGQITTSLTLNNAGWDGSYEQFRSFMNWYVKHSWSRWSRSLSLETQSHNHGDPSVSLGAGFGTHFFWYGGRLFWFIKSKLESSGTAVEKYEITIRGFTRNRTIFMNMMEEFRYRVQSNTISVYTWDFDSWSNPSPITRRPLETVIMERGLKERLISDINCFFESREWYEQRGLPYKRCILFYGPPGTGKAQPLDALVKIPGGWKQMGAIQEGDLVTAWDGTPTKVLGVYPQGVKQTFSVTFRDGRTVEACDEHLWRVYSKDWRTLENPSGWKVINTMELFGRMNSKKQRLYVQLCLSETNGAIELPIHPYNLGVILGDGCLSNKVAISKRDEQLFELFKENLPDDLKLSRQDEITQAVVGKEWRSNSYRNVITELGLMGKLATEKFIPEIYLHGSTEQRLALVQGLMDTDGTVDRGGHVSFCSSSYIMARQLQYLIRSLGGIAKLATKTPTYTYKGVAKNGSDSYQIDIRFPTPSMLFRLDRKKVLTNDSNQYADCLRLQIKHVNLAKRTECQCIKVEHPDHLYVTNDFVVTHNTSIIKALASNYSRNVYILNLSLLSDTSLVRALSMVPEGAIVLIEDFDTNKTVIRRNSGNNESAVPAPNQTEHPQPIIQQQPETFTALSLSGLLNSLDGIVPLDGMLIFMTTNHIEKIDPALLRNGRVDRREYIGYLNDPEVRDYIELVFPGTLVSEAIQFKPIPGCDLMTHFADNRYDVNAFVESIPKDYDPTLIAPTEERLPVLEVPVLKEPAEITIQPTLLF